MREARLAIARLTLFRTVFQGSVGTAYRNALEAVEEALATGGRPAALAALSAFGRLFAALADLPAPAPGGDRPAPAGDPWLAHLVERIALAENAFTRAAEHGGIEACPAHLAAAAAHDLRALQEAYRLGPDELRDALQSALPEAAGLPRCAAGDGAAAVGHRVAEPGAASPGLVAAPDPPGPLDRLRARFAAAPDWGECVSDLAEHVRRSGAGLFGRHLAFRWERRGGRGRLEAIERPDPIRLRQLVGYEAERAQVIDNTERFLAGLPASNVLLYGDRGTGKSSTVKALLHEYGARGLRLIEMSKRHLLDFPGLARSLAGRALRFIVFIDDLSFEEHEVAYKELKAILEGGIEVRPDNVLVYATSNRRHLIKETFADRQIETQAVGGGEVRRQDSLQEKLSLSDRFGLTVIFPTPDQEQYLQIVEALARERGVGLPVDELRQRALRWELYHNGRSGRTARQFVESLVGLA